MNTKKTQKNEETKSFSIFKECKKMVVDNKNYDILEFSKSNRTIIPMLVKKMAESVLRNGLLRDIIVVWSETAKKYLIVDGQHLTTALKELNRSIECRIVDVKEEELTQLMIDLNNTSKSWTLTNYIHTWAENGNYDYKMLQKAINDSKVQDTVILMAYTQKDRASATKLVKAGKFEMGNKKQGDKLIGYLNDCIAFLPNTRPFNQALMNLFIKTEGYNHSKMIKNIKKKAEKTNFSTKEKEIFNQLVEIYNS